MLKRAASRLAYGTLVGSGTARVFRRWNRGKLPILMYHALHGGEIDPVVNFDGMYLHVDRFERQMRYLARHHRVVPLERIHESGPRRGCVAVTFDDGYASVFRYAYPVLKSLGLAATVFVATGFVESRKMTWWDRLRLAIRATREPAITVECAGRRERFATDSPGAKVAALDRLQTRLQPLPLSERARVLDDLDGGGVPDSVDRSPYEALTVEQMQAMAGHGISFQSHGVTHRSFAALSTDEMVTELEESRARIERWVGRRVAWFAYPFGDRHARVREALARTGYEGAVSCRETLSEPGDDRFAIPRLAVGDPISQHQFIAAVSGLRAVTGCAKRVMRMEPVA